jgi:hypothetical protein
MFTAMLFCAFPSYYFCTAEQSYSTSDSQSVSKSWCRAQSGTFDQRYIYIFFFQSYCLVFYLGHSLWRGVGSVICQSLSIQSTVASQYLHTLFTFCVTHISQLKYLLLNICIVLYTFTIDYNKIQYVQYMQASFSPGFVQQIMPYLLGTTAV